MKKFYMVFFSLFFLQRTYSHNVGLLIVATGRYIEFVPELLNSARVHFLKQDKVTFFIFTDGHYVPSDDTVVLRVKKIGWPFDTMMRLDYYLQYFSYYSLMDYLFACDADMLFTSEIGREILGKRVATLHPGFAGKHQTDFVCNALGSITHVFPLKSDTGWYETGGTYEGNPLSTAFVDQRWEGEHYFAGGFWGGEREEVKKLLQQVVKNIKKDLEVNLIALWHDESHLNRYFFDNRPDKILTSEYCYSGDSKKSYKRKLVALDKNHAEYRK